MKTSKFQLIVLAIFVIAIVAGVIAFATYRSGRSDTSLPPVTVWGTFPDDIFDRYVSAVNQNLPEPIRVTYVYKSPDKFSRDFVSALARGVGPDAILIPADRILPEENKLMNIPYSALTERQFMDSYIQEAQIYLRKDGVLAVPFSIDPLVMYWNRDTFNSAGLAAYPKYWDDFGSLVKSLTKKDDNGNVRKSAVALGTFSNITNAREILGTLLLQAGNPVTVRGNDGQVTSALSGAGSASPSSAVAFFARFSDPANADYSWNRGMPKDKTAFLAGNLAVYFGLASELTDIKAKNPNLGFDVAPIPQARNGSRMTTYGRMYGFSVVRASPNPNAAYQTIAVLSAPENLSMLTELMYVPSVLNSLNGQSQDPYLDSFNKAALIARTWLDADPVASRNIFESMVDSVISGRKSVSEAVRDAHDQYEVVLSQAGQ